MMKEIMAVIRMNKIGRTKKALVNAGFCAFTAYKVMGRGKGFVDMDLLIGAAEGVEDAIPQLANGPRLMPKWLLYMVVPEEKVKLVVETLIRANQTGKAGDGKIFVSPVLDAVRIRTKESGLDAINEMNGSIE